MMKTLKTSCWGLLLVVLFSCSKDVSSNDLEARAEKGKPTPGTVQGTPKPILTASQNPASAIPGSTVTVTYNATSPVNQSAVACGRITIYMWNGTEWTAVATGLAPTVTYSFTPTETAACAYKFRAGFAPGSGNEGENCQGSFSGVDYTTQQDYCVIVSRPCVEKFTIDSDVSGVNKGNGVYEFTVNYTLSTPVDIDGVHFQGGATAGGNTSHAITYRSAGLNIRHANNNNTVLEWDGDLKACTPKVFTFKYTRNFSCPATMETVTGNWSASSSDGTLGEIAPLVYSCN
jgi:hypothetical protein